MEARTVTLAERSGACSSVLQVAKGATGTPGKRVHFLVKKQANQRKPTDPLHWLGAVMLVTNPTTNQALVNPRELEFLGAEPGEGLPAGSAMGPEVGPREKLRHGAVLGRKFPTLVENPWNGNLGLMFDEEVMGSAYHTMYGSIVRKADAFWPWMEENKDNLELSTKAVFYILSVTAWLAMEYVALKDVSINNLGRDPLCPDLPRLVLYDTAGWKTANTSEYWVPDGMVRMLKWYRPELLQRVPRLVKEQRPLLPDVGGLRREHRSLLQTLG